MDFGDGPNTNNIILRQVENTSDMMLEVWVGGEAHRVVAEGAITEGEIADWSAGVDPDGLMWIGKDGAVLAETAGELPEDVDRANLSVGSSNWAEDYGRAREQGAKDAHAEMAGADDWVDERITVNAAGQDDQVASSYLESQPVSGLSSCACRTAFGGCARKPTAAKALNSFGRVRSPRSTRSMAATALLPISYRAC